MMRFLLVLALILGALFYSNPTEKRLREVMRQQDNLTLTAASLLPIKRTNYFLASKFEIKYLVGSTTCYGAAYTVIFCPNNKKRS
jgi:TorA maturation chaperone TorD